MNDTLFTTKKKVKERLGITSGNNDVVIGDLIEDATAFIQLETGRKLIKDRYEQYFDVNNEYKTLILDEAPLQTVFLVQYRSSDKTPVTGTNNRDYGDIDSLTALGHTGEIWTNITDFEPAYGDRSTISGKFPEGKQTTRVVYEAGYLIDWNKENDITAHTLPEDISGLATRLVIHMYNTRNNHGRANVSNRDSSQTLVEGLTEIDKRVLYNYKRWQV